MVFGTINAALKLSGVYNKRRFNNLEQLRKAWNLCLALLSEFTWSRILYVYFEAIFPPTQLHLSSVSESSTALVTIQGGFTPGGCVMSFILEVFLKRSLGSEPTRHVIGALLHVYVHIPHFGKGPRFWHTVHLFRRCPRLLRCTSQSLPLVMNAISAHMLLHAALDIKRHQRSYCKGLMGFYMFPCDQESHGRIQIPDIVSIGKEIYWCLIIETPCPTNSRLWYKKEYSKYMTGLLWWLSSCG